MKNEKLRPKHLVFVRHGESEGDARRAESRQLQEFDRHPRDEEETKLGHEQSRIAGLWIAKFILRAYDIDGFDAYLTSPLIRTRQSADSLGLTQNWANEYRLSERDRGKIAGLTKHEHQLLYPKSYQQMLDHPFHWSPPGGESLLRASYRLTELLADVAKTSDTALFMTHRDLMWAAHIPMDGLGLDEIELVDTDLIGNGHIFHYTNINPTDGMLEQELRWKTSIDSDNQKAMTVDKTEWIDLKSAQTQSF